MLSLQKSLQILFIFLCIGITTASCNRESKSLKIKSSKTSQSEIGDLKNAEPKESSYFSLKSDGDLFPSDAEPILLSFYFKYTQAPPLDKRQRLVTNYDSQTAPYAGWALSLIRLRTSTRLEFYLKDQDGTGGWYTLSPLPVSTLESQELDWHALSFLVLPGNFISSVYAKVNDDFSPYNQDNSYITGVSIDTLNDISANSYFQVTSGETKTSSLRVEIRELVLFKLKNIPSSELFLPAAKAGPRGLKKTFKDSCVLAIEGEGKDFCDKYAQKK